MSLNICLKKSRGCGLINAGKWKCLITFGYRVSTLGRKITKPKNKTQVAYNEKKSFTIESTSKERKVIYFPI